MEDHGTINVSGPSNMTPRIQWRPCFTSNLIDEFIRDGWIRPEDKWLEVANIYRGQSEAHWRTIMDMRRAREEMLGVMYQTHQRPHQPEG